MKIHEIINEDIDADLTSIPKDQVNALKGPVSMPGISQNKSNGNAYQQYRFGLALGGVDGKGAGLKMPAAGAFAGDPLLLVYAKEEMDMINDAAKVADAGSPKRLASMASQEKNDVYKQSPIQPRGPVKPKRSKNENQ
jgi:hypothetical protein